MSGLELTATSSGSRRFAEVDYSQKEFSMADHGGKPSPHDGVIISSIKCIPRPASLDIHMYSRSLLNHRVSVGRDEICDGIVTIRRTDDPDEVLLCNKTDYSGPKFLAVHPETLQRIAAHVGMDVDTLLAIRPPTP